MRRFVLGALAVLALVGASGCGSSGDDSTTAGGSEAAARAVERDLRGEMQRQLRARMHDRGLAVSGMRCRSDAADVVACVIAARDSRGARGTVSVAIAIDNARGEAQAQFTGTSRRAWAVQMNRRG